MCGIVDILPFVVNNVPVDKIEIANTLELAKRKKVASENQQQQQQKSGEWCV